MWYSFFMREYSEPRLHPGVPKTASMEDIIYKRLSLVKVVLIADSVINKSSILKLYKKLEKIHAVRYPYSLCKVPRKIQKDVKRLVQQVFYASSYEEGIRLGRELIARFGDRYPSAMECMEEDLEECLTYLRFPGANHKAIRTTNFLERLFGEGKRRTKVIPRFPSEESCFRLVYACLITASKSWRSVRMTPDIW